MSFQRVIDFLIGAIMLGLVLCIVAAVWGMAVYVWRLALGL